MLYPFPLELFPFPFLFPLVAQNYSHSHGNSMGIPWEWEFPFPCTPLKWRPAGWSTCLPLLIFPCTIKSRSSLLAPPQQCGSKKGHKTVVVLGRIAVLGLLLQTE